TGIVLDGVERRILVLWLPIRDAGGQQLGAVRAMRLAQVEVPVRNRYLQDYDLAELWRGDIMPPFAVAFTGRRRVFRGDPAPLTGPDGTILGWAQVVLPSEALLVAEVRGQARSIMAFWLVLLGGWLLAGCWAVLNHALRRAIWGRGGLAWWRAGAVLVGWVGVWSGARFGLLALEVPARWVERGGFASSLFDPAYLGSSVLWGLLQSAGDLLLTAIWMVGLAAVALRFALLRTAAARLHEPAPSARLRALVGLIGLAVGALGIVTLFVVGARHAILDATLGYFDRSGPMPEPLTVLVFASLLGWAGATVALVAAAVLLARVRMHLGPSPTSRVWKGVFGLLGTAFVLIYASVPLAAVPPWVAGVMIGVAGSGVALFVLSRPKRWVGLLTIRGLLVCVLLVVPLT
ncbi:MAG: hypothetical protein HKN04_07695, partial [Rhodothermaceae bacterium]|nr:hypothetical protein [Rhodothermaceae bacterium]